MAAPLLVGNPVLNQCTLVLASAWDQAVDVVGIAQADLNFAGDHYDDLFADPAPTNVTTFSSQLQAGVGTVSAASNKVTLPSAYVVDHATGLLPNVELDDHAYTLDSGITSATFDLGTLKLTVVFKQAEEVGTLAKIKIKTAGGTGYAASALDSGTGEATHVYSMTAAAGAASSGTLDLNAGAVSDFIGGASNLPISGFALSEVAASAPTVTSASFNLETHRLMVVFSAEVICDTPSGLTIKTAAGQGYVGAYVASGGGTDTLVVGMLTQSNAVTAGKLNIGAATVNTDDLSSTPNDAATGISLSETGAAWPSSTNPGISTPMLACLLASRSL